MDADGNDRERVQEARIAALEARLAEIERRLGPGQHAGSGERSRIVAPGPATPLPTAPQAAGPSAPAASPLPVVTPWPVATPPPDAPTYWTSRGRPRSIQPPAPARPAERTADQPTDTSAQSIRRGIAGLSVSLADLETRLTGRALAWGGGLALVLGTTFFLSLAFSRGWIGPEFRVLIGMVVGTIALAGGGALIERGNRLLGHVLAPVGLAAISISLVGATRLYGLIPIEIGLAIALASAVAAALIAVRSDSPVVAGFGLVSVLAAPPLLDAAADVRTFAFVAVVLIGTTGVSIWRTWSWLPGIAFLLSAPQAAAWILVRPEPAVGLAGIGLFWLLNATSAGGEQFRGRRDDLRATSAGLLAANAAFLVWAGFTVLVDDRASYRGAFLVLVAAAHVLLGGYFLVRDGERNLFGLLSIGTGIGALTMAAPVQLGAPAVPLAWAAEAVAISWLAVRRGHPYGAMASAVLYLLAALDVVWVSVSAQAPPGGTALIDGPGAALAFFVVAIAVGVWLVRDADARAALVALGVMTAAGCVVARLEGSAAVVALIGVAVAGVAARRGFTALPSAPIQWQTDELTSRVARLLGSLRPRSSQVLAGALALVAASATAVLVFDVYGSPLAPASVGVPFVNAAGGALLAYLVGLGAIAVLGDQPELPHPLTALGLLVVVWACVTELDGLALILAWAALMVLGLAIWYELIVRRSGVPAKASGQVDAEWLLGFAIPGVALAAGGLAALHAMGTELPLSRFGDVRPPDIPFSDTGAVAAGILVLAVLLGGAIAGPGRERRISIVVAGAVAMYTIPYEVYAWAVVVLWCGLGLGAMWIARVDQRGRTLYLASAIVAIAAATAVAVRVVAPPTRLVVISGGIEPLVAIQSSVALGVVALAVAQVGRFVRSSPWGRAAWAAAGIVVVYLLSIGVVDLVATRVGR